MPAEQEPRTKNPAQKLRHFVRGSHPAEAFPNHPSRFLGKRLNIELGQRVVNSGQKFSSLAIEKPAKTVLLRSFLHFTSFVMSRLETDVVSRSPDRDTRLTEGLPYARRPSVAQVAWSETMPQHACNEFVYVN